MNIRVAVIYKVRNQHGSMTYSRYGRICHILLAIAKKPIWFVSKCK